MWSVRGTSLVLVVAGTAVACWTPAAGAAWKPASPLAQGTDAVVVPGAAGQASVVQSAGDGEITVAVHAPGADWVPPRTILTSATAEDGALGEDGSVAARTASGQATVGQVGADGTLSRAVVGAVPAGTDAAAVASANDGSSLVALTDDDDNLGAYLSSAGQIRPVVADGRPVVFGAGVTDVAIVATGPSRYAMVWSESSDEGSARVRTASVSGTGVVGGSSHVLSGDLGASGAVDALSVATTGDDAVAGWIVNDGETGAQYAQVRSATAFREDVAPVTLNSAAPAEYLDLTGSAAGVLATWGGTFARQTTGGISTVSAQGAVTCTVPQSLARAFGFAGPAGPGVAGAGTPTDGGVLARRSVAGCVAGPATAGPSVGRIPAIVGGVDGEGTVVAVVGAADAASQAYVDDVAAPAVSDLRVPAAVDVGVPFGVGLVPSDAWGPTTTTWFVDDAPLPGTAPRVTVGGLPEGRHLLRAEVADAAGNRTSAGPVEVQVVAGAPTPPDVGGPVAPPVVVPVPETPTPTPDPATPPGATGPKAPPAAGRPRVLSASLVRGRRGWRVRARVRRAALLRIELFRARPLPGRRLRRPTRCGRPLERHAPGGRQGARDVRRPSARVDVAVTGAMTRALRRRGRYVLVVRAYDADGRRSAVFVHRQTVC